MPSVGIQMLGSSMALLGWVGVIVTCALPMWKVSSFTGVNVITAQIIWEGIWMSCVVQSTGQTQCKVYDSMLALSTDLQAARALIVIALVTGALGLIVAFIGGKCTNFVSGEAMKAKATSASGLILISTGVLCLVPVTWTASSIVTDFYNPMMTDAQRREMGASLYVGWGAAVLLMLGGVLLCSPCPPKQEQSPSVKYLIVRSSQASSRAASVHSRVSSRRTATPTKTYI